MTDLQIYLYPNRQSDDSLVPRAEEALTASLEDITNNSAIPTFDIEIRREYPDQSASGPRDLFGNFRTWRGRNGYTEQGCHLVVSDEFGGGIADAGTRTNAYETDGNCAMGGQEGGQEGFFENGCVQEMLHTFIDSQLPEVAADIEENDEHTLGMVYTDQSVSPMVTGYWDRGLGNKGTCKNDLDAETRTRETARCVNNAMAVTWEDRTGGGGGNEAPTASLDPSTTTPSVGERVTFDASASSDPDGTVVSYEWAFGDGTTATGQTARHSYSSAGSYTVTLTVTDDAGATDTARTTIDVQEAPNEAPTAAIDASTTTPTVGESVTFDGAGSTDPDGSIVDYAWDFGDGATASGETVSHSFSSAGSFTVTLTVTDGDGATDTARADISVSEEPNEAPTASIDAGTTTPSVGQSVQFDGGSSSDPDGSIQSYEWDFGDGTTASGAQVSHAFSSAGDYTVTLTVTDDAGASDDATVAITVQEAPNEPPTANISVSPATPTVGEVATLNGSGSSDPDGSIASFEWTVDGTSVGTGETLDYTFQSAGSHQVGLTVTDDDGATDGARQTVTVEEGEDGNCGDETDGGSASSSLWGWWDSDSYTYGARTSDPCSVTFALEGAGSDFDLYVTFDGRTPTTRDFDARSISPNSSEEVAVDNVDAGQEFGLLVDSYRGSGSYEISATERGK